MSATGHGYRTLKSIFHERNEAAVQAELQSRRHSYCTYLLDGFKVRGHPMFYLADRTVLAHYDRIMATYLTWQYAASWPLTTLKVCIQLAG